MSEHKSIDEASVALLQVDLKQHQTLIEIWLELPHVAEWWGSVSENIQSFAETDIQHHFVIAVGSDPVGYLRWQAIHRDMVNDKELAELVHGSIDIDIFIGEQSWLGRGVGPLALQLLLRKLQQDTDASRAALVTSIHNRNAIQAYKKAGFKKLAEFDDSKYGRCWVLTKALRVQKG